MLCDFALLEWETPFLGCAAAEDAGAALAVHEDMTAEAVMDCFAAAHGAVGWRRMEMLVKGVELEIAFVVQYNDL